MSAAASFEFGPFRLDPDKRVLWRGGEVVGLTPKALALLQVLVEHGGDVVPKQELMTRVWPDTVVEEANLSVTVAALRKVLGDQPDGRSYVQTVPRRGYRFVAPVRGPVPTARLTLAVLPFKDLGPEPQPHLGLGMADAVINRLATCEDLLVRPTGAVFHYADAPKSPREAGRELGVGAVVDGTVQRRGERVRVTVHVVPLCPEAQPWAGSFDAESPDLFAVQDTVADRVAEALRARLRTTEKPASETSRKPNREAHEAYLRGRYFWARFDPEGIGKAFGCFGEAATLDPGYGAPHAGLAAAHVILGFGGVVRPHVAWQLASECAERALASDPTLADAHVARAYVTLFRDWEWETARASLERAAALSPGAPGVHQWFGFFLVAVGDLDGARRELARARQADPLSGVGAAFRAFVHQIAGEHEAQVEQARRAVELRPASLLGHWSLGVACIRSGRADEGLAVLRRAVELSSGGPVTRSVLALGLAAAGRRDEARVALGELDAMAAHTYVSPCRRAAVLVALGDVDRALERLEEACADRDPWVVFLRVDPAFARPRSEGRLDELLLRVLGPDSKRH